MSAKIQGFTHYRIDAILKFGGSLTRDLTVCRALIHAVVDLVTTGKRVIVVPGGGRTDKTLEELDRQQPLAPDTAHRACALAQDQTGLILADPAFSTEVVACETLGKCMRALRERCVPVLLPSRLLFDLDPVEKTWDVTSDAVAAWVAWLVGAPRVAILTDVDGIYRGGRVGSERDLIAEIDYDALQSMGHTSIDKSAVAFIAAQKIEAVVLNGAHPERLKAWMCHRPTRATKIVAAAHVPDRKVA